MPDGEGTSGQSLERAVAATLNHGVAVRNYIILNGPAGARTLLFYQTADQHPELEPCMTGVYCV